MPKRSDRRATNRPGPHARPTVKRIELDPDVAQAVRTACIVRHGTAGKADVTRYVNDMLRLALNPRPEKKEKAA